MPPSPKFTREEIISAAFELVKKNGADSLTARSLADALGSSPRPLFTVFEGMDEIRDGVVRKAKDVYLTYVNGGLNETIAFKGVGTSYIRFASDEPQLFRLLFMSEMPDVPRIGYVLGMIDESYERILSSVADGYGLDRAAADELYRHLWIYTHGIAVLIATGVCSFTGDEVSEMLTTVFKGVLTDIGSRQK